MPILIFIIIAITVYVVTLELEEKKRRPIPKSWLVIAAVVGLVIAFGLLVYFVAHDVPIEDAFPGSGDVSIDKAQSAPYTVG